MNDKAGKAAALPKFSDMLTLSQPGGGRLCPPIGFACLKKIPHYAPATVPGHFLAKSDHSEPAAAQLAASIELQQSSVAKATLKGN